MSRFRLAVLLCVPIVAALSLSLLLAQAPPAGKKVAILVGVKSYRHADLPDLDYTERDVEELAKLLEPAGYAVTLLTSGASAESKRPSQANIRTAVAAALKDVSKHDTVLVCLGSA